MQSLTGPLTSLAELDAVEGDSGLVNVVIDTPRGSRCKYKYDEKKGLFRRSKLLPLGASFPHDFGFIPSTRGDLEGVAFGGLNHWADAIDDLAHGSSTGAVLARHIAVNGVVLNAVLPPVLPLPVRFAVPVALPLETSQAYACMLTVPAKPVFGRKRMRSLPASSSAAISETFPIASQWTPSSMEYCHTPFVLPVSAVTAIPGVAPLTSTL
jgi:hypothetical protein